MRADMGLEPFWVLIAHLVPPSAFEQIAPGHTAFTRMPSGA